MNKKILTIFGLIGVGVAGRLLPHLPNATPITAITLAAHKHVGRTWSLVIPMAAMILSDMVIGFYDWKIMISVYVSFILIAVLSRSVRKSSGPLTILAIAVAASVLFFLVTNSAVWFFSPWYEKSISGLFYCYMLGAPFLRNMLLGDIVYTTVLLGARTYPKLAGGLVRYLNTCKV